MGNMKDGKDWDTQPPEPQVPDNSSVQCAVILVAVLGTETLQTLTRTPTEACHVPSSPRWAAQAGQPAQEVQHRLTKADMELPVQSLSTMKKWDHKVSTAAFMKYLKDLLSKSDQALFSMQTKDARKHHATWKTGKNRYEGTQCSSWYRETPEPQYKWTQVQQGLISSSSPPAAGDLRSHHECPAQLDMTWLFREPPHASACTVDLTLRQLTHGLLNLGCSWTFCFNYSSWNCWT